MFELTTIKNTRRALAVIMLLLLLAPLNTMRQDWNRAEDAANSLKPVWTVDRLVAVREEIVRRSEQPADALEYFRVLDLKYTWEAAASRYMTGAWRATAEQVRNQQMVGAMAAGLSGVIHDSQRRYHQKYSAQGMIEVGRQYRAITGTVLPWQYVEIKWSPSLGGQFVYAYLWIVLLSFFSTLLAFWDAGNLLAFSRRLPLVVSLSFLGPLGTRWAHAEQGIVANDLWFATSFATATLGLFAPSAVVIVRAQAPTTAKAKTSVSRSETNQTDGAENTGQTGDPFLSTLRRFGITQINVEAMPAASNGRLPELTIEYLGSVRMGKAGTLKLFGFGELRPGSQFTNHSVSWFPFMKIPIGVTSEQGWNGKRLFGDAGVKWSISGTPGLKSPLGKVFDFATLSYTWKYAGAAPQRQFILVWDAKDWAVWKDRLSLSSEGFIRIRPGGTTNYGQPQILAQFGRCTWVKGLVQFDTAGRKVGVSAGAKFFFALR